MADVPRKTAAQAHPSQVKTESDKLEFRKGTRRGDVERGTWRWVCRKSLNGRCRSKLTLLGAVLCCAVLGFSSPD
jgi:hypothetical protein